ncbi:MotA/TolQ/ExbB proton channel family protein [bacterium]|nr:MotA/TolQ/ExbB proton channel family protein [bacterium]
MLVLTNVLYWISTALLIPVIVTLIAIFVMTLILLGGFYGSYTKRLHLKKKKQTLLKQLMNHEKTEDMSADIQQYRFFYFVEQCRIKKWQSIISDKLLADYELENHKQLEKARTMMRLGPMLGLMGTLIPMGPALVGLASGDIESMAVNMQVAFSTTVVGVFVGAIGFVIQLIRHRWNTEDLNDLQFVMEVNKSRSEADAQ